MHNDVDPVHEAHTWLTRADALFEPGDDTGAVVAALIGIGWALLA